jgi:hypothetical protein
MITGRPTALVSLVARHDGLHPSTIGLTSDGENRPSPLAWWRTRACERELAVISQAGREAVPSR